MRLFRSVDHLSSFRMVDWNTNLKNQTLIGGLFDHWTRFNLRNPLNSSVWIKICLTFSPPSVNLVMPTNDSYFTCLTPRRYEIIKIRTERRWHDISRPLRKKSTSNLHEQFDFMHLTKTNEIGTITATMLNAHISIQHKPKCHKMNIISLMEKKLAFRCYWSV